jgi:riboflavin kinase/FMN adenylyltransferase
MQIFRNPYSPSSHLKGCVLAIGNFDGVHVGHRAVLEQAQALSINHGAPFVVMTFSPHPRQYFSPASAARNIEPLITRLRRMRELHADGLLLTRFNAAFASVSAKSFVEDVLVGAFFVTHVVVGEDFHFGSDRSGNIRFLQDQAVTHRFGCTYVPPVMMAGAAVSSTRVRGMLSAGDMHTAATLLGRPYEITGRVVHGEKRGRTMDVPTANITLEGLHLPRFGVYAVRYSTEDAVWMDGVANLGVRPTFGGGNAPLLEVHGLGGGA